MTMTEEQTQKKDHPHIHGEHSVYGISLNSLSGSPPHTWGTRTCVIKLIYCIGITPTYMGNTSQNFGRHIKVRDHPHIHGEHHLKHISGSTRLGSPPHTWGTLEVRNNRDDSHRITPTYMGNT